MRTRITEHLDIDLDTERWCCNRCSAQLGSAHASYKEGLLVAARDPAEVHFARAPRDVRYSFARSGVVPHRGVLLPALRAARRDRVPAARPPDHP
jgi:Acetone carboxylase gamma subunit